MRGPPTCPEPQKWAKRLPGVPAAPDCRPIFIKRKSAAARTPQPAFIKKGLPPGDSQIHTFYNGAEFQGCVPFKRTFMRTVASRSKTPAGLLKARPAGVRPISMGIRTTDSLILTAAHANNPAPQTHTTDTAFRLRNHRRPCPIRWRTERFRVSGSV